MLFLVEFNINITLNYENDDKEKGEIEKVKDRYVNGINKALNDYVVHMGRNYYNQGVNIEPKSRNPYSKVQLDKYFFSKKL